jgi:cytochrome o ubiquinol oxidase subunit 3
MSEQTLITHTETKEQDKVTFGFWVYLLTDCVLFASLFATYAVLRGNTFGGPSGQDIFNLPFVLLETLILLTSSFTCGLTILALNKNNKHGVLAGLVVTFLLGASFLFMELHEFSGLMNEGNGPERSAFLSAFFTLVGTHGLHILFGLIWLAVLIVFIERRGLIQSMKRKVLLMSMFWHFLDVVWIFIFTIVYLYGHL